MAGHALSETLSWHNDLVNYLDHTNKWIRRGGNSNGDNGIKSNSLLFFFLHTI